MIDGHVALIVMVALAFALYVALKHTEAREHMAAAIAELPPVRVLRYSPPPRLIAVVCGECGAYLPSVDTVAMALVEDEQHQLTCPARVAKEGAS